MLLTSRWRWTVIVAATCLAATGLAATLTAKRAAGAPSNPTLTQRVGSVQIGTGSTAPPASGSAGGLYFRDGHYYMMTAGTAANTVGATAWDIAPDTPTQLGPVAYSTRGSGDNDLALVDLGTGAVPPALRIANQAFSLPVPSDPQVSVHYQPTAAVTGISTGTGNDAISGTVLCQSGFSAQTQAADTEENGFTGVRCGTLDDSVTTCDLSSTVCDVTATNGNDMMSAGDEGSPVWKPLTDGSVKLYGTLSGGLTSTATSDGFTTATFTPVWAVAGHNWAAGETLSGYNSGAGGNAVSTPQGPVNVQATGQSDGSYLVTWNASVVTPGDPVTNYIIYRGSFKTAGGDPIATVGPTTLSYDDPGGCTANEDYTVVAEDQWGFKRPSGDALGDMKCTGTTTTTSTTTLPATTTTTVPVTTTTTTVPATTTTVPATTTTTVPATTTTTVPATTTTTVPATTTTTVPATTTTTVPATTTTTVPPTTTTMVPPTTTTVPATTTTTVPGTTTTTVRPTTTTTVPPTTTTVPATTTTTVPSTTTTVPVTTTTTVPATPFCASLRHLVNQLTRAFPFLRPLFQFLLLLFGC